MSTPFTKRVRAFALTATAAVALTGCGSGHTDGPDGADPAFAKKLVVATHDSWAIDPGLLKQFEKQSGIKVSFLKQGDVGTLVNKLVLTKDAPLADMVFGIDNTFATRAADEGVLLDSDVTVPSSAEKFALDGDAGKELAPIDYGDVCVNVDTAWFAKKKLTPPRTLDDLTKPAYKGLFVTPGATTSSPGLAFLLATIADKGDGWTSYWKSLMANDAKVVSGWTDAYEGAFTAGGGNGTRPIVVSYSSSPPFTIPKGASAPTTKALLDTCFRQVEYAGVLTGAKNPSGAEKFIDFLLQRGFQQSLPDSMYVYPVTDAPLPAAWKQFAPTAAHPFEVSQSDITTHRTDWLREWRDVVTR